MRNQGLQTGRKTGVSIQGPYVRRAHKDCRMNSHGFREGYIQNAPIQDVEFYVMSLVDSILLYTLAFLIR